MFVKWRGLTPKRLHTLAECRDSLEFKAAVLLARRVEGLFDVAGQGRWSSWYDQVSRSSKSVCLNIAEAYGTGQIYKFRIARGEAFEAWATLGVGPAEAKPLQEIAVQVVALLDAELLKRCDEWEKELYE